MNYDFTVRRLTWQEDLVKESSFSNCQPDELIKLLFHKTKTGKNKILNLFQGLEWSWKYPTKEVRSKDKIPARGMTTYPAATLWVTRESKDNYTGKESSFLCSIGLRDNIIRVEYDSSLKIVDYIFTTTKDASKVWEDLVLHNPNSMYSN